MNCTEVQKLMSAYLDDELDGNTLDMVSQHLADCESCMAEISEFRKISLRMNQIPQPKVPPAVWSGIVAQFTDAVPNAASHERPVQQPTQSSEPQRQRRGLQRALLTASILLLLGAGVWLARDSRTAHPAHQHSAEFVMTMDHYLKLLATDPDGAEQFLQKKYDGRVVDGEGAVKLVGYRPAVASGLPDGYTLASTSVLKMPCCTCVQAVCKRQDGSTLVLFEHDDEKTEWFGKRPSRMATCANKECCLTDLDSSIAATWKRGSRSVTAVGARDVDEVNTLVSWLDRKQRTEL